MPITKEDLDTAKQKDRERAEDKAQAKKKEEERKENEAPRKAISDAVDYVKGKLSDESPAKKETPRKLPPGVKSAEEIIRALRPDLYPDNSSEKIYKAKGGSVGSASKRADGIAQRGKTKGKMV